MTPEQERARYVSYSRFIQDAILRYLAEHPVPGSDTPARRVTVRPRFPEYELRYEFRGWTQKRPVTYFEVYRGPTYLGSTWAVSHGGWMIWRAAEDEDPRFINRLGDRLGAKDGGLGFRSKRSQAVRVLLEYPNDPPYPRSVYDHHERWPGAEAFDDFVWTARNLREDSVTGSPPQKITMGRAFSLALHDHHREWYEGLIVGLDPHDDDTRIPAFLMAVRDLFRSVAT